MKCIYKEVKTNKIHGGDYRHWKEMVVPHPQWVYSFWAFFFFFLTSDLSSWASELFHLLAHCLATSVQKR